MDLIDRYIYAVTEHLPENAREDISRELRANIEDMLPENPTEAQIREVLEKLGSPSRLASEYSPTKRYLIGPELYDSYISVLKLAVFIASAVLAAIALLEGILGSGISQYTFEMSIGIFSNTIASAIEGATHGAIWVTVIFVLLERNGINDGKLPFIKKKWSVDDLLKMQVPNKRKISRGETIFAMIFTIFFISILSFAPQLFGWYTKGENGYILSSPLFNTERLQYYMPIFLLFAIIALCILIWKLISMAWNIPLAVANMIYNIAVCILVGIIIQDTSLFNSEILSKFADIASTTDTNFTVWWQKGIQVSFIVFVGINLWDSISAFVKCRR